MLIAFGNVVANYSKLLTVHIGIQSIAEADALSQCLGTKRTR